MKTIFLICAIAVLVTALPVSCKKDKQENNAEIQIEAGSAHSLILKTDNTLWTSGDNFFGQLGDGSLQDRNLYVPVYLP